ncbi:MAG: metal ABC transporter substrate-binding protein [bacterium]|nr:metal ABC transporter substrate-binding protein [bacterium]
MRKIVVCVVLIFIAAFFTSCTKKDSGNSAPDNKKLKVSASILPLAYFASAVGGELTDVTVIVPPGANPHVFEPSPGQLADFSKSDVFICVGAGFEFWKDKFIDASGRKDMSVVELSDGLELIGGGCECCHEHEHSDEDCHEHDSDTGNPHIWTSPKMAAEFAVVIEKAFSEKDPANSEVYKKNALKLISDLKQLDEECRMTVKGFKDKKFLSQHAVWSYFALEYGLDEAGNIEKSPGKEPSPAEIEALIKTAEDKGVSVIFTDAQFSPKAAEAVSKDGNLKIVVLDAIGSDDKADYIVLMRENLRKMKEAMN